MMESLHVFDQKLCPKETQVRKIKHKNDILL